MHSNKNFIELPTSRRKSFCCLRELAVQKWEDVADNSSENRKRMCELERHVLIFSEGPQQVAVEAATALRNAGFRVTLATCGQSADVHTRANVCEYGSWLPTWLGALRSMYAALRVCAWPPVPRPDLVLWQGGGVAGLMLELCGGFRVVKLHQPRDTAVVAPKSRNTVLKKQPSLPALPYYDTEIYKEATKNSYKDPLENIPKDISVNLALIIQDNPTLIPSRTRIILGSVNSSNDIKLKDTSTDKDFSNIKETEESNYKSESFKKFDDFTEMPTFLMRNKLLWFLNVPKKFERNSNKKSKTDCMYRRQVP